MPERRISLLEIAESLPLFCEPNDLIGVRSRVAYSIYTKWCNEQNKPVPSCHAFGKAVNIAFGLTTVPIRYGSKHARTYMAQKKLAIGGDVNAAKAIPVRHD